MESYIHRSGRTGRAGRTGVCICFYQRKEEDQLRYVENKAVRVFLNSGKGEDGGAKESGNFSYSSSYVKIQKTILSVTSVLHTGWNWTRRYRRKGRIKSNEDRKVEE